MHVIRCIDEKLFNLKMVEGSPAVKHLNKLNTVINELVSVDIKFDGEV